MKEQWKDDLKAKLADYCQPAPELSWTDIEKAIETEKLLNHRKSVLSWTKRAAAAILFLLVGGASYLAFHSESNPTTPQPNHFTEPRPIQYPITAEQEAATQHPSPNTCHSPIIAYTSMTASETSPIPQSTTNEFVPPSPSKEEKPETGSTPSTIDHPSSTSKPQPSFSTYQSGTQTQSTALDSKLTAQVYMSNSVLGLSQNRANNTMFAAAKPYGTYRNEDDLILNNMIRNMDANVNSNIHHHQPIRIGASVNYRLTNRWSIGTGISYSYLSTDIDDQRNESNKHIDQKLIFVGIPVTASYRIWDSRRFNVYTSGGIMGEKMVKGRTTTKTYVSGQQLSQNTKKVKIHPLQWSVNGSIGAEYKLDGHFSIYAEPGISYYFDNKSDIPTIYQDKPVNFNLNLGVRLNIK